MINYLFTSSIELGIIGDKKIKILYLGLRVLYFVSRGKNWSNKVLFDIMIIFFYICIVFYSFWSIFMCVIYKEERICLIGMFRFNVKVSIWFGVEGDVSMF